MLFDERPGRVYRSAEEGRQGYARHDARLDRSLGEPPTSTDAARERPPGSPPRFGTMGYVALELDPVGAAFPDSVAWEFKLRPAVRGGIPSGGDLSGFVRRVYVRGRVDFLLGAQRQRVVRLEGEVSYRPGEDELSLGFELALLSW